MIYSSTLHWPVLAISLVSVSIRLGMWAGNREQYDLTVDISPRHLHHSQILASPMNIMHHYLPLSISILYYISPFHTIYLNKPWMVVIHLMCSCLVVLDSGSATIIHLITFHFWYTAVSLLHALFLPFHHELGCCCSQTCLTKRH